MSGGRIVVYLLRRDLRTADNPIFYYLSITAGRHGYTHLLPVYVLPSDQIELSGFLKDGQRLPLPYSMADTSKYWKCGIHRAKFLAESAWDLKSKLEALGSGLIVRAGSFPDVLKSIVQHYAGNPEGPQVAAVWLTKGFLLEEVSEQRAIAVVCDEVGIRCTPFRDQKWFIDSSALSTRSIIELPNTFLQFQTQIGRVEDKLRSALPPPAPFSLPPFPDRASLPAQHHPFEIPETLPKLIGNLGRQVKLNLAFFRGIDLAGLAEARTPSGGETQALHRLRYVIRKGIVSQYHTIDDLEERDGIFKLSAYLSLGCITARQVHEELVRLEQGTEPSWAGALGFGEGENRGTKAFRAEMLHIDFIRLSIRKYGQSVYSLEGSGPGRNRGIQRKTPHQHRACPDQVPCPVSIEGILVQFQVGATGFGLIDAIMRQLLCTGHISARSQMLAANFLAKFAGVDWRYGVEWVASLSIDHDPSLHWYRWQHYVGIGPDPSGGVVTLSPAHAALEFDPDGSFVRKWMPELRRLTALPNLFQVATTSPELLQLLGLSRSVMVTAPVRSNAVNCQHPDHRRGPPVMTSTPRVIAEAAGGPMAVTSTSRGPTIVVSDPRAVAAAAALREARNNSRTMPPPPRGPRVDRSAEATQPAPRTRHVAQILQHPRTDQRPSGVPQEFRGSSQAPPNAPRGPRADSRPSHAQSNAPPNAPRAPRADYRPSQPPRNAPQAPRGGQHWQHQTPEGDPQAQRTQNWQYQSRRNVAHGNISTPQAPQHAFNALQAAARAPPAMQTLPATPHWTPQIAEPFVGANHPTTYPYSLYTSPPCPTYYGSYAFSRPATYQYMEEMPYYQVLQDYYQWHASGPGAGSWNAAPPEPDEVMRHGMILRFLDSLPPPPANPEFPPDPPQLYRRTRRRRRNRTQSSRESGATGQTSSTEGTTAIARPGAPTTSANVTSPQATQRKPHRRGKRGKSGRHRRPAENKADGSEGSGESRASGEAVEAAGSAEAAEAVESGDLGDIAETEENGQDGEEGEESDDDKDDENDDQASAATCMW
ncbi:hypothetical protein J3F83DRAFT_760679 [Trichoderma novae-zelandiae]